MQWFSDLMKHVTVSKSFAGAVFVTSAVLLFGPLLFPEALAVLPNGWRIFLVGALVFTGALLVIWSVPGLWKLVSSSVVEVIRKFRAKQLSSDEEALMHALADLADEPLDLRMLDYESLQRTKLDVMDVVRQLSDKGLVETNRFEENLVSLTPAGRKRALEVQKAAVAQT
jgi:hypothetical protein